MQRLPIILVWRLGPRLGAGGSHLSLLASRLMAGFFFFFSIILLFSFCFGAETGTGAELVLVEKISQICSLLLVLLNLINWNYVKVGFALIAKLK